ncbi:piggyBac transposable element-derived protein 3-like [Lepeophtheirus salmonis]|uniref:piggyBac transposable element-derived protein 3-like n=1 Tax=Lepeophtheirus salmonis TaxID=72036 RepID=UPI003AF35E7C
MYWQGREYSSKTLIKKAISRNRFDELLRYSHFTNNDHPNLNDPFWKVAMPIETIKKTAKRYAEKSEYICMDESMVKYFGPHSMKQYAKATPIRFGFLIGVLATFSVELMHCIPHGGAKNAIKWLWIGTRAICCLWPN